MLELGIPCQSGVAAIPLGAVTCPWSSATVGVKRRVTDGASHHAEVEQTAKKTRRAVCRDVSCPARISMTCLAAVGRLAPPTILSSGRSIWFSRYGSFLVRPRTGSLGHEPSFPAGSEISPGRSSEGQVSGDECGPLVGSSRPQAVLPGALENLVSACLRMAGFRRRVWISLWLGPATSSRPISRPSSMAWLIRKRSLITS